MAGHVLSITNGTTTITLTSGEIPIASSLNINGPGSGMITVSGNMYCQTAKYRTG